MNLTGLRDAGWGRGGGAGTEPIFPEKTFMHRATPNIHPTSFYQPWCPKGGLGAYPSSHGCQSCTHPSETPSTLVGSKTQTQNIALLMLKAIKFWVNLPLSSLFWTVGGFFLVIFSHCACASSVKPRGRNFGPKGGGLVQFLKNHIIVVHMLPFEATVRPQV